MKKNVTFAFREKDAREQIQLIVDLRRAIDVLLSLPQVDPQRLAYVGQSYGGAMGGLLANCCRTRSKGVKSMVRHLILPWVIIVIVLAACTSLAELPKAEEIAFYSGEFHWVGDLRLSKGSGRFPVVILIPGSEPGDRCSGWLSLPPLILVTFSPIIFLSGLVEVFESIFWTLSYPKFRPLSGDAS